MNHDELREAVYKRDVVYLPDYNAFGYIYNVSIQYTGDSRQYKCAVDVLIIDGTRIDGLDGKRVNKLSNLFKYLYFLNFIKNLD